ncbi:hypothetical protein SAMN05216201_11120 [Pseudomonas linyingensis]|uniref:Uncharacterized protein n=1 Tax=Pseudomonas linyingensis TaxID=915471 RepID=A0A1H6ZTK9_9PSED|nr:hypothetical protein [Pseudomonas linyingensis]SEJ56833.1 hypothetical protein SAMN05216201_11120 [Pseudomonas linyingensis]
MSDKIREARIIRAAYEVLLGCVSSQQIAALLDVPTVERVAKQLNDLLPGRDTPAPAAQEAITEHAAHQMGATGAEPTEAERLLFEAWMRGHCWAVVGEWDGRTYTAVSERGGLVDLAAMRTRQLWAAWRDRAALAGHAAPPAADQLTWICRACRVEQPTDRPCDVCGGSTKPVEQPGIRAARDVLAERLRQVDAEGFDAGHDDMATRGQLAVAAGYYALSCGYPHERDIGCGRVPAYWPWDKSWWKPLDARSNLVRAGALILAEIERLDRALLAGGKA